MQSLPELLERRIVEDPTGAHCLDGAPDDLDLIYDAWIEREGFDSGGALARSMFDRKAKRALERVQMTLLVGSVRQRERAIEFLSHAAGTEASLQALDLCRHAGRRAQRRGEEDLVRLVENALLRLESSTGRVTGGEG
jgi:hypothetical protein